MRNGVRSIVDASTVRMRREGRMERREGAKRFGRLLTKTIVVSVTGGATGVDTYPRSPRTS